MANKLSKKLLERADIFIGIIVLTKDL
jgi:hypothetical protein